MFKKIVPLSLLALFIFFCGCGPKAAKPGGILDTPQGHYEQGKKFLEKGNYDQALSEFQRSKALDPKYAPAYEGLALAYLGLGDLDSAWKNVKECKKLDRKYSPGYVAAGRIYDAEGKYKKAISEYKKALRYDSKNTDAYYHMGKTYVNWDKYDDAEKSFKKGLEIEPTNLKLDEEWKRLQDIRRAAAGMPPEYVKIAKCPAVTRADIAALFVHGLELPKLLKKAPVSKEKEFKAPETVMGKKPTAKTVEEIPDIQGHWAKSYIGEVVKLGVIELYPDGTFKPDEKITRANYAKMIELLIAKVTADPKLTTRFIGSRSPFPDVPKSHYTFNAVMVVTTRGIMKAKMDGNFGLMEVVPGTSALDIIKKLKDQL